MIVRRIALEKRHRGVLPLGEMSGTTIGRAQQDPPNNYLRQHRSHTERRALSVAPKLESHAISQPSRLPNPCGASPLNVLSRPCAVMVTVLPSARSASSTVNSVVVRVRTRPLADTREAECRAADDIGHIHDQHDIVVAQGEVDRFHLPPGPSTPGRRPVCVRGFVFLKALEALGGVGRLHGLQASCSPCSNSDLS